MSIQLVTYANQTVTPTNDAIIYERAIDQNGIFYGCNVTVSSNNVNITGGYGIICGREFTIQSESIAVTLAPSGTLDGRLYVRLDLADADAPIQLLTATGNTLPPLEQDSDVNYTNGTYEMELATFTVGVSALSDVAETFVTITGTIDSINSTVNDKFQWKYAPLDVVGTTPINISGIDFTELCVQVDANESGNKSLFIIPKAVLSNTASYFRNGGYHANNDYELTIIHVTLTSVTLVGLYLNGQDYKNTSRVQIYYR